MSDERETWLERDDFYAACMAELWRSRAWVSVTLAELRRRQADVAEAEQRLYALNAEPTDR